jgi:hypothetical protein
MMAINSSSVPFTLYESESLSGSDGYNVVLEQLSYDSITANYSDAQQMMYSALAKNSAHDAVGLNCPIIINEATGIVTLYLTFYALLSNENIEVTLSSNVGDISYIGETLLNKSQSVLFGLEDEVDLGYRITDVTVTPESVAVDSAGDLTATPTVAINNTSLSITEPLFYSTWVNMKVPAEEYQLVIDIATPEDGYEISSISPTILATWTDIDGAERSTSLDLTVPDCVYDSLSSCSNNELKSILLIKKKIAPIAKVYYNTCNGKFIGVRWFYE